MSKIHAIVTFEAPTITTQDEAANAITALRELNAQWPYSTSVRTGEGEWHTVTVSEISLDEFEPATAQAPTS